MADAFTGEIRIFGGNYNPRLWALCDGGLLSIQQNTSLFSVIADYFGGDGRVDMGLPHLCGRTQMGTDQGPGLTPRYIGQSVGYEMITIDERHIPAHTHPINVSTVKADLETPASDSVLANATEPGAKRPKALAAYAEAAAPMNAMNPSMLSTNHADSAVPHENRQPYLAMNFIICLEGIYPSRT